MHSPAAQSLPSFVLMLMFEAEIYATGWYAQCFFEARFQQMKWEVRMKIIIHKMKWTCAHAYTGDQSSHLNWSSWEFRPQFWTCLTYIFILLVFFIKSSLAKIRSWKSSNQLPNFMKQYPNSLTFMATLKLGMNQGLVDQTGVKN
jgi:hypothetical protein